MSYSWVDPHFALRFEERETERLTERLLQRVRVERDLEADLAAIRWTREGWRELDLAGRPHLRLL